VGHNESTSAEALVGGRGCRFPYGTSRYNHSTVRPKEQLSGRPAEGAEPLGSHGLRQRDVGCG
jgi:hypothetical protein